MVTAVWSSLISSPDTKPGVAVKCETEDKSPLSNQFPADEIARANAETVGVSSRNWNLIGEGRDYTYRHREEAMCRLNTVRGLGGRPGASVAVYCGISEKITLAFSRNHPNPS
ncbi:hypothetical protein Bbelb_168180 [Branchiostoma belcheri]|nr:hypothetical protein Bbelb_168180 [Branchiostoma belcheri]